ncbi:hypothetical protein [Methylobacterium sp. Leaf111]|nr:hypothetical protein [Methylobacterium sp. Leaf111]
MKMTAPWTFRKFANRPLSRNAAVVGLADARRLAKTFRNISPGA